MALHVSNDPADVTDADVLTLARVMGRGNLTELRRGLMTAVAAVEVALGHDRRCPRCAAPLTVGNRDREAPKK
jgi:hypothetical protein